MNSAGKYLIVNNNGLKMLFNAPGHASESATFNITKGTALYADTAAYNTAITSICNAAANKNLIGNPPTKTKFVANSCLFSMYSIMS